MVCLREEFNDLCPPGGTQNDPSIFIFDCPVFLLVRAWEQWVWQKHCPQLDRRYVHRMLIVLCPAPVSPITFKLDILAFVFGHTGNGSPFWMTATFTYFGSIPWTLSFVDFGCFWIMALDLADRNVKACSTTLLRHKVQTVCGSFQAMEMTADRLHKKWSYTPCGRCTPRMQDIRLWKGLDWGPQTVALHFLVTCAVIEDIGI